MNGFALENAFARRKTKNGLGMWSMVAVNRGFHGGKAPWRAVAKATMVAFNEGLISPE